MDNRQALLLRRAFFVGAVTDALALIPLLIPQAAALLWGFEDTSDAYRFATGYAAALMLGWTALLVWAHQRPLERAFVAPLTVLVIYGLVLTELAVVISGDLPVWRMIPTWCLQATLLGMFVTAYHYPMVRRVLPRRLA